MVRRASWRKLSAGSEVGVISPDGPPDEVDDMAGKTRIGVFIAESVDMKEDKNEFAARSEPDRRKLGRVIGESRYESNRK